MLAKDLLQGAQKISEYTGISPRRIYYLAEKRLLPVIRIGAVITARKSELDEYFSARNNVGGGNDRSAK